MKAKSEEIYFSGYSSKENTPCFQGFVRATSIEKVIVKFKAINAARVITDKPMIVKFKDHGLKLVVDLK